VRSLATELTILEEIRTAPKWYPNAEMAVRVAKQLNRPVLVRVAHSPETAGAGMNGADWRQVLDQTVNISLTSETIDTLPTGFVVKPSTTANPTVLLFEGDGTLLMSAGAGDEHAQAIAAALAKRTKEPAQ
jgi:hypothetical protein